VYVIGSLNWISFSNGFVYGQVAGLINSLQKQEGGIHLSEGQISLIASTMTIMNLFGTALSAIITDKLGRRWPFILFSIPLMMNWILLYYATELHHFVLSRIIGGISVGALVTLNIFVTSEYTSPKTRAFYLNMVTTLAPALGTSLGHGIGIFLHWRTSAIIGIFPCALGILLPYFWEESPHWLASKGRFEECRESFGRLHTRTPNSDRELKLLVEMEKSKLDLLSKTNSVSTLKRLSRVLKRKYFWDVFVLSIFIHAYLAAAGKLVFSILATVILEEITGTPDVLLYTLFVDGFIVIGSFMSCLLIRKTSMRTLLFSTGFTANAILILFTLCFYFRNGQSYSNWINVGLLALYFITINAGPYPLLEAIYSEMFPLELKVYIFTLSAVVLITALTLSIILLPFIVSCVGYHGLFLMNAAIMSVSLVYIWWRLPETKGKTLQEVEVYFKTNNFNVEEVLTCNEQTKALI
ncbi:jg12729, partial [Pararge aegeria aegeria]